MKKMTITALRLPHFGCPLVCGAGQIGKSITTDGWVHDRVQIPKGLSFRFAQHETVYRTAVAIQLTPEHRGVALLWLEPPVSLEMSPADNEGIVGIKEFYDIHTNEFKLISELG